MTEVLYPHELWRNLPNYEDRYRISNRGNVYSIKYKRIMTPHVKDHHKGYFCIDLYSQGGVHKKTKLHQLVIDTFVPSYDSRRLPDVHHIDHNKRNNQLNNLIRLTHEEHSEIEKQYREKVKGDG